jgi:hypothetical protein
MQPALPLLWLRVHGIPVNVPVTPETVKVTVPVGIEAPEPPISDTVTKHVSPWPTAIVVGKQESSVEVFLVPRPVTITVRVPLLIAWAASPL